MKLTQYAHTLLPAPGFFVGFRRFAFTPLKEDRRLLVRRKATLILVTWVKLNFGISGRS